MLLAACFFSLLSFSARKSITNDEVAHLGAGYVYLVTGDVALDLSHPPLLREIYALPILLLKGGSVLGGISDAAHFQGAQFAIGNALVAGPDGERIVFWARVPAIVLSTCLGALVALWATELWGVGGGLLALSLYTLDPTITAHAQLATTDVGFAFFATSFLYLLRRHLRMPSTLSLVVTGVALGLALGAKFSGVVLVPMAVLLLSVFGRARGARAVLVELGALGALAYVVLWVIYLFPSDPLFYLHGMRAVNRDHTAGYNFYLMGELRPGGWSYYFLIAWLVKTPLASLALFVGSLVLAARGTRSSALDEAALAIPALALFGGYSMLADDIGVRYLIPCLPFVFLFTARLAPALSSAGRAAHAAAAVLVAWYVLEFAVASPNHLSYFNQIAGGSRGGTEWLDDSNVDWGQGVIQLRDYLAESPHNGARLCYFGSVPPERYGVALPRVELGEFDPRPSGTLILSAQCVARGRAFLARAHGRGPRNWLANEEPAAIVGAAYYVYPEGRGANTNIDPARAIGSSS